MYGSIIVRAYLKTLFKATPGITATVGQRIFASSSVPEGVKYPYLWIRRVEPGIDSGTMGGKVEAEELNVDVSIVVDGRNVDAIVSAADAMHAAIEELDVTTDGYQITARGVGELPDIDPSFGSEYEQLGRTYTFTIVAQ